MQPVSDVMQEERCVFPLCQVILKKHSGGRSTALADGHVCSFTDFNDENLDENSEDVSVTWEHIVEFPLSEGSHFLACTCVM